MVEYLSVKQETRDRNPTFTPVLLAQLEEQSVEARCAAVRFRQRTLQSLGKENKNESQD
jgi:hypothetical protein